MKGLLLAPAGFADGGVRFDNVPSKGEKGQECDRGNVKALVLFGPPGSGKGTQAKMLKECLTIPHISTGDMLRTHILANDEIGRQVVALMKAGSLVPDSLVNLLVKHRLAAPDCASGFILDGYPRTRQQAETLDQWLEEEGIQEVVIHLVVDYNILIRRLTGRRLCPQCGTLYNLLSRPPKSDGICDKDGTALIVRPDDSEDVIRGRLEAYERQTMPLIEYFRENGRRLVELDAGAAAPKDLLRTICRSLDPSAGVNGSEG
jgi:adenylate kinase